MMTFSALGQKMSPVTRHVGEIQLLSQHYEVYSKLDLFLGSFSPDFGRRVQ